AFQMGQHVSPTVTLVFHEPLQHSERGNALSFITDGSSHLWRPWKVGVLREETTHLEITVDAECHAPEILEDPVPPVCDRGVALLHAQDAWLGRSERLEGLEAH